VYARIGVRWGIALGASVCIWTLAIHALGFYTERVQYANLFDNAVTVLPIVCVTGGLWEARKRRPFTIGRAVATGLIIGAASLVVSAPFFWYYHHSVNPHWVEYLVENQRRQLMERQADGAEVARRIEALRKSATDRAQITGQLVGTLLLSLVLSILSFAVIRQVDRVRSARASRQRV